MVLTLLLVTTLYFYFQYRIKKLNKRIDDISDSINLQLDKNKSYLLEEINNKHKENIRFIRKELYKTNKINTDQIDKKHQQLVSGEMKKLKTELNKDLNDIVESVKNVKII